MTNKKNNKNGTKSPKKNLPPVFKEVSVGENKKSKGKIVIGILFKDKEVSQNVVTVNPQTLAGIALFQGINTPKQLFYK